MAITYVKDIPDFNIKVKQVTDIDSLETTVSQLSASLVTVKGDVTEAQGDITTLAGAMTTANEEIDDIWKSNNVLGAKNLIPYPYEEDSEVDRGITWTNNVDGTVTATGTATSDSAHNLSARTASGKLWLKNGQYILSGTPSGGTSATYYIEAVTTQSGSAYRLGIDEGSGCIITVNGDDFGNDGSYVQIRIIVKQNYDIPVGSPITFYPMVRPAEYQDSTYAPYAMTNKDITNIVKCNETTNGTYTLKATVSSGVVTYAWTADS